MKKLFTKIVDAKPDELRALWLAFVFNFVVLAGYYILRPIREEIGATSGVENLPWMYTATLIGMLIANALFAAIVSRMSRRKFLPIAYRFAIANLFIFFILMRFVPANWQWLLARSFFVWVSVFNLFATTLFWAFMTDLFTAEQGKRLFGFIAVVGSLGAILGPLVPTFLVDRFSIRILWQNGFLGQHAHCIDSTLLNESSAKMVRRGLYPRAHAGAERARFSRDRLCAHPGCASSFSGGAAFNRVCAASSGARNFVHRFAARRQIQSEKRNRYIRLSSRRYSRRLVV